jgi:chaperone required for assembly of F1-ATPase
VLDWASNALDAPFQSVSGIQYVPQKDSTLNALRTIIEKQNEWNLTATYLLTTLTGSVLLALQLHNGNTTSQAVWAAANVEEDYQISQWGEDWEAKIRREARVREFVGLVRFLELLRF